jgi:acyl-CoA thioesterase-2
VTSEQRSGPGRMIAVNDTLPPYSPADIPTLFDLAGLLAALDVRPGKALSIHPATSLPSEHGGVLGSQLLGQYVALAERLVPAKRALTVHASFVRSGGGGAPLTITSQLRHDGRSFADVELNIAQGETLVSHADVLLHKPESGLLRGGSPVVAIPPPAESRPVRRAFLPWETRESADGVTLWQRIADAGSDPTTWRALLAYTTEIPGMQGVRDKASRQHADRLPTLDSPAFTGSVLSQRISFLEELDVREWHRINVDAWWAEYGRVSVRGSIADLSGRIGVTFEQIGLLREVRAH